MERRGRRGGRGSEWRGGGGGEMSGEERGRRERRESEWRGGEEGR